MSAHYHTDTKLQIQNNYKENDTFHQQLNLHHKPPTLIKEQQSVIPVRSTSVSLGYRLKGNGSHSHSDELFNPINVVCISPSVTLLQPPLKPPADVLTPSLPLRWTITKSNSKQCVNPTRKCTNLTQTPKTKPLNNN